jgi:glutathione S-transferase kappa 1
MHRELLAASDSAAVKERLRAQTQRAVDLGGFGVPLMAMPTASFRRTLPAASGEESAEVTTFFGSDRFEQMAFYLGKDWLGPNPPCARL